MPATSLDSQKQRWETGFDPIPPEGLGVTNSAYPTPIICSHSKLAFLKNNEQPLFSETLNHSAQSTPAW